MTDLWPSYQPEGAEGAPVPFFSVTTSELVRERMREGEKVRPRQIVEDARFKWEKYTSEDAKREGRNLRRGVQNLDAGLSWEYYGVPTTSEDRVTLKSHIDEIDMTPRTKREALLMRKAFLTNYEGERMNGGLTYNGATAARLFPIPTRTVARPKEIAVEGETLRYANGKLEYRTYDLRWAEKAAIWVRTLPAVMALISAPTVTETVEVEE